MVTSFEYRLYPVGPEVKCTFVFYPGDRAIDVLRSIEEGEEALEPLRTLRDPIVDSSGPMPYTELLDKDYPNGWRYYWKSVNVDGLGEDVIEALMKHAEDAPSDHSTIDLWSPPSSPGRPPPTTSPSRRSSSQ